jgi:hypothetical protein
MKDLPVLYVAVSIIILLQGGGPPGSEGFLSNEYEFANCFQWWSSTQMRDSIHTHLNMRLRSFSHSRDVFAGERVQLLFTLV